MEKTPETPSFSQEMIEGIAQTIYDRRQKLPSEKQFEFNDIVNKFDEAVQREFGHAEDQPWRQSQIYHALGGSSFPGYKPDLDWDMIAEIEKTVKQVFDDIVEPHLPA